MFSTFHRLVSAYDATNVPPLDAWRFVAAMLSAPRPQARELAGVLADCALRLALGLRDALHDFVPPAPAEAGCAEANGPAPRPSSPATTLRSWLSADGSRPFEDVSAGYALIRPLQDLASPPSHEASDIEGETRQALIYFDLTDVVSHAIWHDSCAGIPRVQLEVATSLVKSSQAVRFVVLHHGKWCDLRPLVESANGDVDSIFRLIREAFADLKRTPRGLIDFIKRRRKFRAVKGRSRRPELKPCDTLFIGGAFWANKEIIDFCRRAAEQRVNLIVLFHDLIPLITPYFAGHDFRAEYLDMLRLPAHFIVTTPRNRRDLEAVRQSCGAAGLLTSSSVVPLADEFPGAERNELLFAASDRLARLAGEDFALCVGTVEIRKNHLTLLLVWEELAAELGERLPKLVVAGRRGWKADAALAKLDEANSATSLIEFVEAPTDSELRWLYSSCRFTVFPSYFEGWGLPVGESFWFGKPCAASNTGSIPFVGRDLCAYFSPFDAEEMKEAIRALSNPETRRSFQAKIRSTRLRTWRDVARDIKTIIIERRPPSDGCQFQTRSTPTRPWGVARRAK